MQIEDLVVLQFSNNHSQIEFVEAATHRDDLAINLEHGTWMYRGRTYKISLERRDLGGHDKKLGIIGVYDRTTFKDLGYLNKMGQDILVATHCGYVE